MRGLFSFFSRYIAMTWHRSLNFYKTNSLSVIRKNVDSVTFLKFYSTLSTCFSLLHFF